ncbi:pimeloyl-ACP methyl ester carboxylesterase [Amycolatopsis lexingtonensis]|uniref:Pimeloyl-ACP methyl ester carboxylesterase n=1 Tax=Amycolatopsis lexingtonensis TaxID=218822 RepID=A0ABR9HSW1_9PSEU|nr:alpha/beta hydrolase [Amycolatopsis lexingtonensis]MBE1494009.1 pimeloyl-ACP methyl ester carboxylesterase [Amycolatopsis lexingtonensis]
MTDRTKTRMRWQTTLVAGRPAHYGVGGEGPPVLFLHGWGIADRAFGKALETLTAAGLRVYAPALPGFGGTAELPRAEHDLAGYARWVAAFLERLEQTEPVTLVGYSFGGGVAIRTAHDTPELVQRLILVNSIGGSAWTDGRGVLKALAERPLWDWGLHLQADLLPTRQASRVLPVVLRDLVPNLARNPGAIRRVAHLARSADLTPELAELKRRRLPVVVVWSKQDNVIPEVTLLSLRAGLGDPETVTVPGGHTWLLAEPERFGEVITNILALTEEPPDVA